MSRRLCRRGRARAAEPIRDYVDHLVAPYFEAVVEWLQALHIGQTGGALNEIISRRLGDKFFGIFLNPGHQIHLDEWVNLPVWPESPVQLRSGMAMQVDIIPATGTDYFTTKSRMEFALADESLRAHLATEYPEMWARITGPPSVHGQQARHQPPRGRSAALEHDWLPAAVPAPP